MRDDGITPEVLKREDIYDIVLQFCNNAPVCEGQVPDQCKTCNIIPVLKVVTLPRQTTTGVLLSPISSVVSHLIDYLNCSPSKKDVYAFYLEANQALTGQNTMKHVHVQDHTVNTSQKGALH